MAVEKDVENFFNDKKWEFVRPTYGRELILFLGINDDRKCL